MGKCVSFYLQFQMIGSISLDVEKHSDFSRVGIWVESIAMSAMRMATYIIASL
jgi:hypothetical protein